VNEPLARQLFGGEDPVGRRLQFARRDDRSDDGALEIVGVVAGVRHDIFDKGPVPHIYVAFGRNYRGGMNLHVRLDSVAPAAEASMLATLRQEIRAVDPNVPIVSMQTLQQHRDNSIALWAVNSGARLFSVFGGLALVLAVVGVYGVRSYIVSRRTREIGIRMALGATPRLVVRLVMREALTLTLSGIGLGLLMSYGVAKALSGMLYEVTAHDPVVFAVAPLMLVAAVLLASYVPARRASHVGPTTALRAD
jgi:ABC-type antimicrobial peptide transport system permease subunit